MKKLFLFIAFVAILGVAEAVAQTVVLSFTGDGATISSEGTYTIPKSVWDDPAFQNFAGQTSLYLDIVNSLEPIIGFEGALVNVMWGPAVGSARTSEETKQQYIQVDIPGLWSCLWTLESNQGKTVRLYVRRVADPTLTIGEESKPLSQWDLTSPIDVPRGTSVTLEVDPWFVNLNTLRRSGTLYDHSKTLYDLTDLGSGNVGFEFRNGDGIPSNPTYSIPFTLNYVSSTVPVTGVTLDQTVLTKTVGDASVTLVATVQPGDATNKDVSWSTSNSTVATVTNGVVNFVGVGNATITVTTQDGAKTATCSVTVSASTVPVTGVTLDQTVLTKTVGDGSVTLVATVQPGDATNKNVSWSTSNSTVATVTNGVVNFVGVGNATITVTTQDGARTATCSVTVSASTVPVTGVTLDQTVLTKTVGDASVTLVATVQPGDATNKDVSWSTSNSTVATVTNGVVNFVGVGNATITVTTQDGAKTATCSVSVAAAPVPDFTVSLTAVPSEGGAVTGGGTFVSGTQITVAANAHPGFVFLHWSENGMALPVPSVYTFGVSANRSLVAHFEATGTTNAPELASTASPLRAWTRSGSGMLHISGATIGEPLSIYSVSGALVYQALPQSAEIDVALSMPAGVYVINSGENTARVVVE